MKTLLKLTLILNLLGLCIVGKADELETDIDLDIDTYEREIFDGTKKVKSGDTVIFTLETILTIDRLAIELEKVCLCSESSLRVSFDGANYRGLELTQASADETTHLLNVGGFASTIEFKNTGKCAVKIKKITVLPRRLFAPDHGHGHGGCWQTPCQAGGDSRAMVGYLLEIFRALDQLVSDEDRISVISEGKKVFGRAQAVLTSNPETSSKAREALEESLSFLQDNEEFVQKLQTIEVTFSLATQIQQIQEMLERMLD